MTKFTHKEISDLYNSRLDSGLPDHKVVGWGSKESQDLRFKILSDISSLDSSSILDVGCGLGDLVLFLNNNNHNVYRYHGIDISENLIDEAKNRYKNDSSVTFSHTNIDSIDNKKKYDYIFCSGCLNLKIDNNLEYTKDVLTKMFEVCNKGVSCNFLSTYADYYADKDFHHSPEEIFTFAKSLSNKITLRHNYELYEFTIYIYKD